MSVTTHKLRVAAARKITHPTIPEIDKHYFLVRALDVPGGIRTDANARDPKSKRLNRRVYRDVKESLLGRDSVTSGSFDLMNKGITILANKVKRLDDQVYEIEIKEGQGIVDGGHTYKIITEAQDDPDLHESQYVEIQVRTGVKDIMITDIARGLNTGIQVQTHSLDNLANKYQWIKDELKPESYFEKIAWKESDEGEYDVRDLICVLEAMNVFDYPNDEGKHPIQAYEKLSVPTTKFSQDYDDHEDDLAMSKYFRLKPILKEALFLFDKIRHDFHPLYNKLELGKGGALDIIEKAKGKRTFQFLFSGLPDQKYRLTKGALYPIFAAFRNLVEINPDTGNAQWKGGFPAVMEMWNYCSKEILTATKNATKDIGHKPDMLGKNRGHWSNLHKTVELFMLRRELAKRR